MNGRSAKKIRREITSRENEMIAILCNYFNSLDFFNRVKIAMRIIRKKL